MGLLFFGHVIAGITDAAFTAAGIYILGASLCLLSVAESHFIDSERLDVNLWPINLHCVCSTLIFTEVAISGDCLSFLYPPNASSQIHKIGCDKLHGH
ncbi:MAG: hypothetical protein ABI378_13985 [Chitinophagaceae bacterium]